MTCCRVCQRRYALSKRELDVIWPAGDDVRHLVGLLSRPKARVVVTGQPGSGKTSLCQRIVTHAQANGFQVMGILSPEVRHQGARIGYDVVDVHTGTTRPFARRHGGEPVEGIPVGRYVIDPAGLAFAQAALSEAVHTLRAPCGPANCHIIVVDEVGRLELLRDEGLMSEATTALRGPASVLVIVRRDLLTEFLARFADLCFHVFDDDARRSRMNGLAAFYHE